MAELLTLDSANAQLRAAMTSLVNQNIALALERRKLVGELEAALDACPKAIRVREGGGPENLAASVAVTLASLTRE